MIKTAALKECGFTLDESCTWWKKAIPGKVVAVATKDRLMDVTNSTQKHKMSCSLNISEFHRGPIYVYYVHVEMNA